MVKKIVKAEVKVKEKKVKQINSNSDRETNVNIGSIKTRQKAYFFPRLIAYIIDILLVSLITTGVLFFVPSSDNYNKYLNEYREIQNDFYNSEISTDEFLNKSANVLYDIDYNNVPSMIVEVVIIILYFVVFQFYNKGQTLGKKLMHIKIVANNDDEVLTMNHYIIRAVIINFLFVNILIIGMVLFMNRNYYYYASYAIQGIQYILIIISIFMVMFRKDGRGLHDKLAKTKVIMCDEV